MSLPNITIDISGLTWALLNLPSYLVIWRFFLYGGWVIFIYLFGVGGWKLWIIHIQTQYAKKVKQILLAIDVPRENEQGPESVERMFSQLTGASKKGDKIERYLKGFHRPTFSFEIVSVDGQIRYFIRTPAVFRDMIEAAVYTAYPDAEIQEAEDYVKPVPEQFPND
jgi:hypothetical protein